MKAILPYLCLVLLLLPLVGCGERPVDDGRVECVDRPLRFGPCMPTPSEAERAAVLAQGLPATVGFELQRAIYLWQQQGFPSRPAEVLIQFDPGILTITTAVALAEQHGVKVGFQYERRSFFDGIILLDAVPALAAERGITKVGLVASVPLDPFTCPTPSGHTPVPITCGPEPGRP